jgi:hypothetical protein
MKAISIDEVKDRIKRVHNDNVVIDECTYTTLNAKARFIDKDYGSWWAIVKGVTQGRRHTKFKCANFVKSRLLTVEQIKEKLKIIHGGIVELSPGQPYTNSHTKMKFVDKDYGEWEAMPYSVMAGHGHPTRGNVNKVKNSKKTIIVQHWKTGKELSCTGSYEVAFVKWCNHNKIDFDWQIPKITPDNRTYFVDAYIKNGQHVNKWIEIKGTWNRKNGHVGKRKWEWFHSMNKGNSELWTREKLIELGIL